jgi:hypothetical protein
MSEPAGTQSKPESVYQRKFSVLGRLFRLLVSPSVAMEDIAGAPDYVGAVGLVALRIVVSALSVWLILQKISIEGVASDVNMAALWAFVSAILVLAAVIGGAVLTVFWLVKSWLVKVIADSGSAWDFRTAASVTGYAYLPDLLLSIVSIVLVWNFLPTLVLDISSPTALQQTLIQYRDQLGWNQFLYGLPLSFLGLVWKSYLGGLGAHFGTEKQCSVRKGFLVFFLLALIAFLFSTLFGIRY